MRFMNEREAHERDEFIFRYELFAEPNKPVYEDPLVELIRSNLEAILDVIVLVSNGKEVTVDSFKLLGEGDNKIYRIYHQKVHKNWSFL